MFKKLCNYRSKEKRIRYNDICNKNKESSCKSNEKGSLEIEASSESPNKIFRFLKMMKREGKDVKGRKCIQDSDRR